jgi:hypothetical protein
VILISNLKYSSTRKNQRKKSKCNNLNPPDTEHHPKKNNNLLMNLKNTKSQYMKLNSKKVV